MALANLTQEQTDKHNRDHCKEIADTLEAITEGRLYKCPGCGEFVADNQLFCGCGKQVNLVGDDENEPFEMVTFWDYFEDALDINYITNAKKEYIACRIMVAWGGPNIYVNTWDGKVELHWWTDRAEFWISRDTCDAIDEWAEEYFKCL